MCVLLESRGVMGRRDRVVSTSRRSARHRSRYQRPWVGEQLEQRVLLTALPQAVEDATLGVLDAIRDEFRTALEGEAQLQTLLPVIGSKLQEALDLSTALTSGLYDPINTFFAGAPTDTGLQTALEAIAYTNGALSVNVDGAAVSIDYSNPAEPTLSIAFTLTAAQDTDETAVLPVGAIGMDESSLTAHVALSLPVLIVMPFDANPIPDEEVFINLGSAQMAASVSAFTPGAEAHLGLLGLDVGAAALSLDVLLDFDFSGTDGLGNLTLTQLASGTIGTNLSLANTNSSLDLSVPVSTTLSGVSLGTSPALLISIPDVFAGGMPAWSLSAGLSALDHFQNMTAPDVFGLFTQLATTLDGLADQLDVPGIPFVEEGISDIIDLGQMVSQYADQLQAGGGGFTFATFQELAEELSALTGLSLGAINVRYDGASESVLLDLDLAEAFNESVLLDFGEEGGPLTVSAGVEASFSANVAFDLTIGFDLTDRDVSETLSDRFFVGEGSGVTVSAQVAATDIDAGAAVGPVGLCVVDGQLQFTIGTSIAAVDPGVGAAEDGRVYMREFIDNATSATIAVGSPTVAVSGELPLDGCSAAMNALLGIDTTSSSTRPAIALALGTANDISSFTATPDAEFQSLLADFADFSDVSVYQAVQQVVAFLSSADIEVLNARLPLINKSVNELLDTANDLLSGAAGLNTDTSQLKTDITAQLAGLDAAVAAAVADPDISELQMEKLFALREAITSALGQADLSGLATAMVSITNGFSQVLADLSGVINITDLSNAASAIAGLLPTLDTLEDRIESWLGLADPALALDVRDVNGQRSLVVNLTLADSFNDTVPLDFSFEGQSVPIGIDSGGDLTVSASATLQLDFGFNLETLQPFLLDTTSATASASVFTNTLSVVASLGGVTGATLGVPGPHGLISVKEKESRQFVGNGSTTNFAIAPAIPSADQLAQAVVLVNGAVQTDGFTLAAGQLTFDSAPANGAAIAVVYPGAGGAAIGLTLVDQSPDADGVIPFGELDGGSFNFSIDGVLNAVVSVDLPISGPAGDLRFFMDLSDFSTLHAALPDDIELSLSLEDCDFSLMVAGFNDFLDILQAGLQADILQKLPLVGDAVDVGSGFIGDLRSVTGMLETALNTGEAAIQNLLFSSLGGLLVDGAGNPLANASQVDVALEEDGACVEINLRLMGSDTYSTSFDLGLDAFIFEVSTVGGVDLNLGFDIQLGLGFSLTEGFYFILNSNPSDPEVEFDLEVDLTQGSTLAASLFFLSVTAEEVNDPGTALIGTLDLNITDPNANGHLSIAELSSASFTDIFAVSLTGSANVDLHLEANVVSDPSFPSMSANLVVAWQFLGNDGLAGQTPQVALNDVSLELGTFLSNTFGPLLEGLNDFLEPIKPVLDFLTEPIPVISDISTFLGGDPVTLVDVIALFAPDEAQTIDVFLTTLDGIVDVITSIGGLGTSNIAINFGDFSFSNSVDLRDAGTTVDASKGTVSGNSAQSDLDNAAGGGPLAGVLSGIQALQDVGLHFPVFENPLTLFNLLFGQRVDLVTWDLPRMSAGINYEQSFGPIIPPIPLYLRIFGGLEVFADLGIGLDTRAFEGGFNLLNGFYLRDHKGGSESPEFGLTATIGAGAELKAFVVAAGVEGGLKANITADWHDIDNDGKFYLDEVAQRLGQGPLCIFELGGSLDAFLNFYVEFGIDTFFGFITLWEKSFNLVDVTLFEFNVSCPPLPPPVLAHVSDGTDGFVAGTLVGHVGAFASLRQPGATDGKDVLNITINDEGDYLVTGFGIEQTFAYASVNGIYINALAEDDQITIDPSVTVGATLLGGDGNDRLNGGSGNDSISGEGGVDWIYGFAGNDTLHGDADGDVVFGGEGHDSIYGGDGDDQLYGEAGNDTVDGGAGNDLLYGDNQPSGASAPATGTGHDSVIGGDGNDQIVGAGGNDTLRGDDGLDYILAGDGNDVVYGGDGNDVIQGDGGNDYLAGDDGDDVIRGFSNDPQPAGSDNDTLDGGEGFDDLAGNKGNDFIIGGAQSDALLGGEGDDTLLGGWGDDVIRGEEGRDYIEGGPDDDDICGQEEEDTIWGGTTLFGLPYITLGYVDPYVGGGFWQFDCDSPIFWTPPILPLDTDDTGSISGQKFHDLNANGSKDPGEPGLVRWTIGLYKADGTLVASQLTGTEDLNGDGQIDPITETGLYRFENVAPGSYLVAETPQGGWIQSKPVAPIDPVLGRAVYSITLAGGASLEDLDFGNYRNGSITGQKYLDSNADGKKGAEELRLNGVTIELYDQNNVLVGTTVTQDIDLDGNNQISAMTERGVYQFKNLKPGTYRVVEVIPPILEPTASPAPVVLTSGQNVTGQDFGNSLVGIVTGTKWNDLNADGKRGSNEPGMSGVTIYADANGNGQLDPGELSTVTMGDNPATEQDETGFYVLIGLDPGDHIIREVVPAGYQQTFPGGALMGHSVVVGGQIVSGRDFGNARKPASIRGMKFYDRNRDGQRQDGEPGMAGWTIYIDRNQNGMLDEGEPWTVTGQGGFYSFTITAFDGEMATIREVPRFGWTQTAPADGAHKVPVAPGDSVGGLDFGNYFGTFIGTNAADDFHVGVTPDGGGVQVYNRDPKGDGVVVRFQDDFFAEIWPTIELVFEGRGGNDTLTVNFANGNPLPPMGARFDGGTSVDELIVLGTAGSDAAEVSQGNEPGTLKETGIFKFFNPTDPLDHKHIKFDGTEYVKFAGGAGDDSLLLTGALSLTTRFRPGTGKDTFTAHGGILEIEAGPGDDLRQLAGFADGSTQLLLPAVQMASLELAGMADGSVRPQNGIIAILIGLSIGPEATLDLTNNGLLLPAVQKSREALLDQITGYIASARNSPAGRWKGAGLTSSNNLLPYRTLGVLLNDRGDGVPVHTSFGGLPAGTNDVLVKPTWDGDANLDGVVNADDYFRADSGFISRADDFADGDFDFNRVMNADDYFLIDSAFIGQTGKLAASPAPIALAEGGEIRGTKFRDIDGDGKRGSNEPGLAGVRIYLDLDRDGKLGAKEPFMDTLSDDPGTRPDETGQYSFTGLADGAYVVREIVPAGYQQTAPSTGFYAVSIDQGSIVTGRDFGNRPLPGEIGGRKWLDVDGDGKRGPNEPGLAQVLIYLDLNNNGQLDTFDMSTVTLADDPLTPTDETGLYRFINLPPGNYIVREVAPAGMVQTYPASGFHAIALAQGQSVTTADFGNRRRGGDIQGVKWIDLDGDGKRSSNEPGLAGVVIYLDANFNGQYDAGELATMTMADNPNTQANETGQYLFTDVPPGGYQVREVVPVNYTQTFPTQGFYGIGVEYGSNLRGLDFGNRPRGGEICGNKFHDLDGDGVRDGNEPGIAGVRIYIDLNNDGRWTDNEPWVLTQADDPKTPTDETGDYCLTNVPAGEWVVREVVPQGFQQTAPSGGFYLVAVQNGQVVVHRDFGNRQRRGDIYGTKFLDLNANRVRDDGEPGLAGITIYVDLNDNGQLDSGEPFAVTMADNPGTPGDESGTYHIDDVPPGTYRVREVLPAPYAQSYPGPRLLGIELNGALMDISTTTGATSNVRASATNVIGLTVSPLTERVYGLNTAGDLLQIDAPTGTWGVVGNIGAALTEGDLDFDATTGRLYALAGPSKALYLIDPLTAGRTLVGLLPAAISDPSAMAFDSAGSLYVVDGTTNRLFTINKNTGAILTTIAIQQAPGLLGGIAGMVFDPLTQKLYLANGQVPVGGAPPQLYTLNVANGVLSAVGPTGRNIAGLTFTDTDGILVSVSPGGVVEGANFGNYQAIILPDGDDLIHGGDANDTIYGDNGAGFPAPIVTIGGNDTIDGNAGQDQLHGQDEDDLIFGSDGDDLLFGESGDDTLDGGAGADRADGGMDDDTYLFSDTPVATTDILNEIIGEGNDTIDISAVTTPVKFDLNVQVDARASNITIDLRNGFGADGSGNFENVIGSATAPNTLIGNAADNGLTGGNKDDWFTGGPGNDDLFGREGDDTFAILATPGLDRIWGDPHVAEDRIDFSGHPGPVFVDLATRTATGVWAFFDIERLTGSPSAGDVLIGEDVDTTWSITGLNQGSVNPPGIQFAGFENLQGGSANDTFWFADGAAVAGTIDGTLGSDLLDYSAYTTAVAVDLTVGTATGTAGVANIENITGGQGDDLLIGDGGPNGLVGNAGNDTLIGNDGNDTLTGSAGDDRLEGGLGNDLYVKQDGDGEDTILELPAGGFDILTYAAVTTPVVVDLATDTATGVTGLGHIEGFLGTGATADTFVGPDTANTWQILAANGAILNGTIAFLGFENLTGGTDTDTFAMGPAGSLSGTLDGAAGADTLDYSALPGPVSVKLNTASATNVGSFAGIESFVGSAGSDSLVGLDSPSVWNLLGADSGDINSVIAFTSFENLVGGSDDDVFAIAAGASLTGMADGGGGTNALDYSAYGAAVTVNFATSTATALGGFANIAKLTGSAAVDTLIGPDAPNTWTISSFNGGDLNGIAFADFENLTGGALADTFVFADGQAVSGTIDGGGATDTLDYSAYLSPVTVDLSLGQATGAGGIISIERFIGTAGLDSFTAANVPNAWQITAANSGTINGAIAFNGFESLIGGSVIDLFSLAAGASVTALVDGGLGINALDYSAFGGGVSVDLNTGSATSIGIIQNIRNVAGSNFSDTLVGDANANTFLGNGGADALIGNAGNDSLLGGAGRDLLIGGNGQDSLFGGDDDDILVAGSTSHDADPVAIANILARWNLGAAHAARVTDIKTNNPRLAPGVTVFNDALADQLTGDGGLDWFLKGAVDVVTDFGAGETLDNF